MKKKGFTLVEMIAVLIVLTIIFLVSTVTLTTVIKTGEDKIENAKNELIIDAAKDYLSKTDMVNNKNGCIRLGELVELGYVDKKEIDESYYDKFVNYVYENGVTSYRIYDTCKVFDNTDIKDYTKIVFKLLGEEKMTIEKGNTWSDPGVIATYNDIDISSSVGIRYYTKDYQLLDSMTTNTLDTYIVEYYIDVNDDGKEEMTIERFVTVVNTTNPVITHPGDTAIAKSQSTFDVMEGVSAQDALGNDVIVYAKTDLSLGVVGTYTIYYTAIDEQGNTGSSIRRITIQE